MAETITIPSPSVFLEPTPLEQTPAAPVARPNARPTNAKSAATKPPNGPPKKATPIARAPPPAKEEAGKVNDTGVTKRKQSKSRNGCITCKAKRLKCDESKPTCQQCARRSVDCGGYKKDFKWRPFEEVNYTAKAPPGKVRRASPPSLPAAALSKPASPTGTGARDVPPREDAVADNDSAASLPLPATSLPSPGELLDFDPPFIIPNLSGYVTEPFDPGPGDHNIDPSLEGALAAMQEGKSSSSLSSGPSPRVRDMLLPGVDINLPNTEYFDHRARTHRPFEPLAPGLHDQPTDGADDIEEVARQQPTFGSVNAEHEAWVMRLPTPGMTNSTSSTATSDGPIIPNNPWFQMVKEPLFSPGSPEMLCLRFDRQTCGVLSVKDGPTENPWRTLIWPLARDNTALYHAIASMTSFHFGREEPSLRVQGIEHMRTSIKALRGDIGNMQLQTSIATTLALAFSESWDQHISTGINHIKGAKILVNQALDRHRKRPYEGVDLARFRFLANTWIYMDVIARLTSVDEDESNDFESVFSETADPWTGDMSIDPLMGCASTLFPIIGRVTNLVRKVRRMKSNSPGVISQALDLKHQLEGWVPPAFVEAPEDPDSQIEHSIQTAEAYRWATLLYLHQAVPEIPSESSAELAKKVMVFLATVPIASRTIIVQIYPLIAAGCEAVDPEDREWVRARWQWMSRRMKLGILDRCAEVVKEVWDRRDAYEPRPPNSRSNTSIVPQNLLKRGFAFDAGAGDMDLDLDLDMDMEMDEMFEWNADHLGFNDPPGGKRRGAAGMFDVSSSGRGQARPRVRKSSSDMGRPGGIDHEFTVRGSLHWIGVMKDWQWEVLLG